MVSILSDIIESLNDVSSTGEFSFYLTAQNEFVQNNPTYPRVVVTEPINQPKYIVSSIDSPFSVAGTTVGYRFDVFARDDISVSAVSMGKQLVCHTLVLEIADYMATTYGLRTTGVTTPTSMDDATAMCTLSMTGVIDSNGYIYTD